MSRSRFVIPSEPRSVRIWGTMSPLKFLLGTALMLGVLHAESITVPLWPSGSVPGSRGTNDVDIPTLTTYPAARTSQAQPAMVILPGGGYGGLAGHEGSDYGQFPNRGGVPGSVVNNTTGTHGEWDPPIT